jgi:hypothetical protein
MVGMMTLLGVAALSTSDDEVSIAGNELQETRAFYASEAGLEQAIANIQQQYEATGLPPTVMPEGTATLNGCAISYETADPGTPVQKTLMTGALTGLKGLVTTYRVTSTSEGLDGAAMQMSTNFEAALVPIFQFAVFYNDDMQATPQPLMNMTGRVHVNGNMYLQAFAGLRFDSYVTCAGSIYHGLKYGQYSGTATADVYFKNGAGVYTSMKNGGSWLDASSANWYADASSRWNGVVRDKAFGQPKLNLPLAGADPHNMIERAASSSDSYENKASIKFIDNKAYQKIANAWVDVTVAMTAAGVITRTSNKFFDARESKNVDITDLDVSKLYSMGYAPANGVIYFSDKTAGLDYPALRLKNATTLGAGLTVASENPVYTLGNYNTTNKKPAAILTDALTIQSAAWDDTKGNLAKASRPASNTAVNFSFVTGDRQPSAGNYQGGLENLPRFLEFWGNTKTCTIRGSMINLWDSQMSTGAWSIDYYEPPVRDWAFDTDLNDPTKLPPMTPSVISFTRTNWSQQHVGAN